MKKDKIMEGLISSNYEFIKITRGHIIAPRKYGTEDLIYTHDLDLISVIGSQENITLSDLVVIEGKSKSALSQVLNKLENKGFIKKKTDDKDSRKNLLRLTPKGKKVYDYHEVLDDKIIKTFIDDLAHYTEEELEVALKVNESINSIMTKIFSKEFRDKI